MDSPHTPEHAHAEDPHVVALVDRAVGHHDQAAFGALYEIHLDHVYRYLYYRTGTHPEAEDLTEQVFLKAWEAIDRFRWQGRPFIAWLYRLAHNLLVDYRRAYRPTLSLTNEDKPIDVASETATLDLTRQLDAAVLGQAMRELTAEQQDLIVLRFIEGRETAEIAQIMDKREGAIRALQVRALLRLRNVLERQGEQGAV